jgi:hypothetical protein
MTIAASFTIPDPTPAAASSESAPIGGGDVTLVPSHCAEGRSLLMSPQWQGKPRIAAMLCAWLERVQTAEAAAFDSLTLRDVETSEGIQLDRIGRVVLEGRRGRSDERYRDALRVRILANRSDGRAEDLIEIVSRLDRYSETAEIVDLREYFPAAIIVEGRREILNDPREIVRFLRTAKGAGVSLEYIYSVSDQSESFEFSDATADASTTQGFGSTTETTGGDLAGTIRA